MIFVDTNYFLRFFLKDNNEQCATVKQLFLKAAQGQIKLFISIIVIFEINWVFKSYYQKTRPELNEILHKILKMNFIQINGRKILVECLELFSKTSLSLEDCYNLAFARLEQAKDFKTFDQKLSLYWTKIV